MTDPDDSRYLYIHSRIEEMIYWAGERRGSPRDLFILKLQRYVRGEGGLSEAHAIHNALKAITEDPKIVPPISMQDLHERVDCFVELEIEEAKPSLIEEARA